MAMASFNFINLAVSRTTHRLKEVGIRKVLGAMRKHLIIQFLGESLAMAIISMVIGLVIFEIARGGLEAFIGHPLAVNIFSNWIILLGIMLMTLFVGLIAGSYPAFYISRFHPAAVLKDNFFLKSSKLIFRRTLLILQFMGAVALIFSTLVIYLQMHYGANKDMGFSTKNILLLRYKEKDVREKKLVLKNEILKNNGVVSISSVTTPPAVTAWALHFLKSMDNPQGKDKFFQVFYVDKEFISTFDMKLVEGRNFSGNISLDKNSVLINETAVRKYNIKQPLGYKFLDGDKALTVIGVVKDFHGRSLHFPIYPVIMRFDPEMSYTLAVKLHPYHLDKTIASLKTTSEKIIPHHPFNYSFLEDEIAREYQGEQKVFQLLIWSAFLAISIACLGLLALISIFSEQRTKEVGIRKSLGASIWNIIYLLSRDFLGCILLAIFLSWPIAYVVMNKWLQNFSYRYAIGIVPFFLSALIVITIAVISIAYQILRISGTDPVKALRYE
jgi:putative ABC transport system permease protein